MSKPSKFCIVGVPDHQGVMNVGGRLGAAQGPSAFRKVYSKFQGKAELHRVTEDLGDVPDLGTQVDANHQKAALFIAKAVKAYQASVVVGGGHDHGYSHLKGVFDAASDKTATSKFRLGCLNIDAHLDVRKPAPLPSSGSPFYLAIESGILNPSRFVEFGIQSHCNALPLWDYIAAKKVQVVGFETLRGRIATDIFKKNLKKLCSKSDEVVISLDLDAAAAAYAPGVSAPQAEGFTSSELIEMVEFAASQRKVKSLGIFELCPEHDVGLMTARLAATCAYHFLESKLKSL